MDELTLRKQAWQQGFSAGVDWACRQLDQPRSIYQIIMDTWKHALSKPLTQREGKAK